MQATRTKELPREFSEPVFAHFYFGQLFLSWKLKIKKLTKFNSEIALLMAGGGKKGKKSVDIQVSYNSPSEYTLKSRYGRSQYEVILQL